MYRNAVRLHLIPTAFLSINYIIIYTLSYRETELKTMLSSFFTNQTESKTIVKENMLQTFCFQELQAGTGMD